MPVIGINHRRCLGIGIVTASLALLLWGLWPVSKNVRTELVSPAALPSVKSNQDLKAASLDRYSLTLEWPAVLRIGDTGQIRLQLEPQENSLGPSAGQEGGVNRLVEVRLELPGFKPIPEGEALTPLHASQPVILQWRLQPQQPGVNQGTLWVHLRSLPNGSGQMGSPETRQVLSAQKLQIRATSLLGLTGLQARIAGVIGCVVGILLILETFYTLLLKASSPSSPS